VISPDVPLDFPAGSIMVEQITTTKSRPGFAPTTKVRRLTCACLTVLAARGLAPNGGPHAKPVEGGLAASATPFLVMLAGTYAQVQAVAANLRSGRRAQLMTGPNVDGYLELAPKAGYRSHTVRATDGTTVLTLYLPWAVQRLPDERPTGKLATANLVTRGWLQANAAILERQHGLAPAEAQQAAIAARVVDRLDKAICRPILADLGFRRFLFGKLVAEDWLIQFDAFVFGPRAAAMCWPVGSAKAIFAHATMMAFQVDAVNELVETATREWVSKTRPPAVDIRGAFAVVGASLR
jgi:hypothetical protein